MSAPTPSVNSASPANPAGASYVPLTNVLLFAELIEKITHRHRDLPGMGVFCGFAGLGKTKAATFGAHRHRAYYLECGESWTKAKFCRALLTELGLPAKGTVADMVDTAIIALMDTRRPLIIDEFDHVVARKYVETIREIHDKSGAPIILIGEEQLPYKLQQWERFHSRVLDWVQAQPCDAKDARQLATIYAPQAVIADDMIDLLITRSKGNTRRVAVNLAKVEDTAVLEGWDEVTATVWGSRPLYTGDVPPRRIL